MKELGEAGGEVEDCGEPGEEAAYVLSGGGFCFLRGWCG